MQAIKLNIPTRLVDMNKLQLLFVSRLFQAGYPETEFLIKALLYLTGLKLVTNKQPAADEARWYKCKQHKKPFLLTAEQLAQMKEQCRFLLEPGEINPIRWIKFSRARHYRFYNASFEEYLMAENYYLAYLETQEQQHLNNLLSVLYRRPWHRWNAAKIQKRAKYFNRVDAAVKNSVFMWYIGFRSMVPKRCPNLFSGSKSSNNISIRDYINGMIHQLSGGNITLNNQLLKQPAWYALDELEQRALDAVKMEEQYKK